MGNSRPELIRPDEVDVFVWDPSKAKKVEPVLDRERVRPEQHQLVGNQTKLRDCDYAPSRSACDVLSEMDMFDDVGSQPAG